MKLVIFGLSFSSSWGNGHATLWRGLCKALTARGHRCVFFEKDVPYYASHRDFTSSPNCELILYESWKSAQRLARSQLRDADVGIVTSYCPDAAQAEQEVMNSSVSARVFYDLDTPVTLERLHSGETIDYIGPRAFRDYDLVLSFTGGRALDLLQTELGARLVAPLYGSVDPAVHRPVPPVIAYRNDLSYLGTYAADRQEQLLKFFIQPARLLENHRFLLAGSLYPQDFPWTENLFYLRHLAPDQHAPFFCSSRLTLNITRGAMARLGHCPSGRLFEAAACGTPILSDTWEGLSEFFEPGREILTAHSSEEAVRAITLDATSLRKIALAAREKTMACHTAEHRAIELERILERVKLERHGRAVTTPQIWGIVPAAGAGSRIQPLAFSKELLPVGSRVEGTTERPRAVSEYLVERMVRAGANHVCFVISPGKSDIMEYFGAGVGDAHVSYTVQPRPAGLCDAIFRAVPLIRPEDGVLIGLPDTIWFPTDGFQRLPENELAFLLFPVKHPEYFDAVVLKSEDSQEIREIQVKKPHPDSSWVWGAFSMPGRIFLELHRLWKERGCSDEYFGSLVNAHLGKGGRALGVRSGTAYVDVGTLHGYREAIRLLSGGGRNLEHQDLVTPQTDAA